MSQFYVVLGMMQKNPSTTKQVKKKYGTTVN